MKSLAITSDVLKNCLNSVPQARTDSIIDRVYDVFQFCELR